jgi:membrane associated rhomboid family serine protease
MKEYRPGGFLSLPPVVKYLLIANVVLFVLTMLLERMGISLFQYLAVYSVKSSLFHPYQLVTHMFMHGSIGHLFFNMFALWMFGRVLEEVWGPQRFFIFYFVCGLGAAILHSLVIYLQINYAIGHMDPNVAQTVINEGADVLSRGMNYTQIEMRNLNLMINTPTVGASGAIYGLLLAFGMLFPNSIIYIYFAFPLKAKYFVMFYAALELYMGISNHSDNIAHFAHLGGMLFGLILILLWRKDRFNRWDK